VLNEYYRQAVTEMDLLKVMDIGDNKASFEDIQQALLKFGFRAVGVSASYDQLARLNMLGIVYLEHRKTEHFSVLRGIDESTVWPADPSLGNRTYSRWQFLDIVGHADRRDRLLYQNTKTTNGPGGTATPGFA